MSFGIIARACIIVGVFFGCLYGLTYAWTQYTMDTAERRGQAGETERVKADPDYRLANKDEFYEKCGDIQALNEKIENTEEQIKATSDPVTKQQLQDGAFALEQQKEDIVADYNELAENENRGAFRDAELPSHIDSDDTEVSCGN